MLAVLHWSPADSSRHRTSENEPMIRTKSCYGPAKVQKLNLVKRQQRKNENVHVSLFALCTLLMWQHEKGDKFPLLILGRCPRYARIIGYNVLLQ